MRINKLTGDDVEIMKKGKTKRFVVKEEQGIAGAGLHIVVDTQTGVNYVCAGALGPQSITPLLDHNGNVIIDPVGQGNPEG